MPSSHRCGTVYPQRCSNDDPAGRRHGDRESLPAYLRQMSILARLEPDRTRRHVRPSSWHRQTSPSFYRGRYFLFPVTGDIHAVRGGCRALLQHAGPGNSELDVLLARAGRPGQPGLRALLDGGERQAIQASWLHANHLELGSPGSRDCRYLSFGRRGEALAITRLRCSLRKTARSLTSRISSSTARGARRWPRS